MGKGEGKRRMGWIPDYPDFRDYTEKTGEIKEALGAGALPKTKGLPASVDLREWCSPVEDQRNLGSCTAQAGAGIIEYYERKGLRETHRSLSAIPLQSDPEFDEDERGYGRVSADNHGSDGFVWGAAGGVLAIHG